MLCVLRGAAWRYGDEADAAILEEAQHGDQADEIDQGVDQRDIEEVRTAA
jgi:hypothetical protein